jgi:hypothetical protein
VKAGKLISLGAKFRPLELAVTGVHMALTECNISFPGKNYSYCSLPSTLQLDWMVLAILSSNLNCGRSVLMDRTSLF